MVTHGNARPNFGQSPDEVHGPPHVVEKISTLEPVKCSGRCYKQGQSLGVSVSANPARMAVPVS